MLALKQIEFFNYPKVYNQCRQEYLAIIDDVLSRGAFIMQDDLTKFENDLAEYLGVRHVVGVADGTMALISALTAAGISQGDEVIVPSHTFVASASAIHFVGGIPILADCEADHLIDPKSVQRVITPKTRAIMPVHLNGRTCRMDEILNIAEQNDLIVVEDSCQALGARYKGEFAGSFGIAGTFSFYPSKTLGCFGDGGAVVTNDDRIAADVKSFRDHGRGEDGRVRNWGLNARLDNLQAAILRLKLRKYDQDIARRRTLAALYNDGLRDIEVVTCPPGPDEDPDYFDIFQNYEIEADQRDGLRAYLLERGIKTILQWGGRTLHQFPELGLTGDFERTEELTKRFMMLPLHTGLSDDDVLYICECITQYYK